MALCYKKVFLAIVIEVFQADTHPAVTPESRLRPFASAIAERAVAVVVEHGIRLAGKGGHDNVRKAVVIVVLKDDAHARKRAAV